MLFSLLSIGWNMDRTFESVPFICKFALHKRQRSCTDMLFTWWACLDALLSRHTLRWSDWLIWPVNHQHRQIVYPISNQYFRPLPKALQRNDSRWKCWANANHSIWRSQVSIFPHSKQSLYIWSLVWKVACAQESFVHEALSHHWK